MKITLQLLGSGKVAKEIPLEVEDDIEESYLLFRLQNEIEKAFIDSKKRRKEYYVPECDITATIVKINSEWYKYQIIFKKDGKQMPKCPNIVMTKQYEDFTAKLREKNRAKGGLDE